MIYNYGVCMHYFLELPLVVSGMGVRHKWLTYTVNYDPLFGIA